VKQKKVGTYHLGFEQVDLFLIEGYGGEFYCTPEPGSLPRIKIGADLGDFEDVLAVLFHEAFEMLLFRKGCRFNPDDVRTRDHSLYRFFMDHNQFSDICQKAAEFMDNAIPDVRKSWKKWEKKRG
jgi:hypothetical protein